MVRLFQNLVGNALKYRKPDVSPVIHVSAEQPGSEWVITVQDNGIGFDPKHSKEIFSPFKRLHSQQEYEGTGVGLAIVSPHCGRAWWPHVGRIATRTRRMLPLFFADRRESTIQIHAACSTGLEWPLRKATAPSRRGSSRGAAIWLPRLDSSSRLAKPGTPSTPKGRFRLPARNRHLRRSKIA